MPGNLTIVRQWMLFHLAGRLLLMLILLRWLYMALLILYADLGLGTSFLIQARGGFPGFAVRRLLGRDLHFGENRSEQHY